MRRFREKEAFVTAQESSYKVLPFRFNRRARDQVFLSTDAGEWASLSNDVFEQFVHGTLSPDSTEFKTLVSKHFLAEGNPLVPLAATATKVRTKYSFLDGFTALHMFVVSLRCDHSCPYCQVSRVTTNKSKFDMSSDTAERAVDWVFKSPAPHLKIEFQGGEPLLALERIKQIVEIAKEKNLTEERDLQFVITTNLSEVTDEAIEFIVENEIYISTSLDGPEWLHNKNRPRPGNDSYLRMTSNLARLRDAVGYDRVAALMTTTDASLDCPEDIVDEYVDLGFNDIFIRPISPYGFAVRTNSAFKYETDKFLEFFKRCVRRVAYWYDQGVPIVEAYSQLIARKLLLPFGTHYVDLQHPAGTGISAIIYNYDGDIYASDEGRMLAEMGDHTFRLGNLHSDSYVNVMGGDYLRGLISSSCLQTVPQCSDCAYLPFCGFDSGYNIATQNDLIGHRPTSGFCRKQMGIFDFILDAIEGEDSLEKRAIIDWAVK